MSFKGIGLTILVILFLIFGGIGIKAIFFPVHVVTQSVDMAYEVTDKTLTAENAIYNYEWFKKQKESIEALYKQEVTAQQQLDDYIKILPEDKEKWTRDDKNEIARLQSVITGIKNMTNVAIAEYTAKSGMVNRAIFKDNLPTNIRRSVGTGLEFIK